MRFGPHTGNENAAWLFMKYSCNPTRRSRDARREAAGASYYGFDAWRAEAQPQQLATAPVARGDVERTVLAVGQLEPVRQVSVGGHQVSGQIKRLAVELGQDVGAGELIAEIDSLPQRNALRTAGRWCT